MLDLNNNELYREVVMDHYRNPRNKGLKPNLKTWAIKNPLCGDSVSVQIQLDENNLIKHVYHESIGCSLSTSSTSILSELLVGKTIMQAINIIENYVKLVKGDEYDQSIDFGDAVVFKGVKDYPARFKCATVSWEVVLNALKQLQQNKE